MVLSASTGMNAHNTPNLSPKDKEDLILMFTQLLDEIETPTNATKSSENSWWHWDSPFSRLERALDELQTRSHKMQKSIDKVRNQDMHRINEGLVVIIGELRAQFDQLIQAVASVPCPAQAPCNCVTQIDAVASSISDLAERLYQLELRTIYLEENINVVRMLLGDPDQGSGDPQDLDSVIAIDESQMSLIQWLKTIYRQQRADDYIS